MLVQPASALPASSASAQADQSLVPLFGISKVILQV